MAKIFKSIILLFFVLSMTIGFAAKQQQVQGAVGMVKIKLVVPIEATKEEVIRKAEIKALGKAASQFVAPGSILFNSIMSKPSKYIAGTMKITKKEKVGNKRILYCVVPINYTLIEETNFKSVTSEQDSNKNKDDRIAYFVRVRSNQNGMVNADLEQRTKIFYDTIFKQQFGYALHGIDYQNKGNFDLDFAMLKSKILDMDEIMNVSFVIITDITIKKAVDGNPAYAEAYCETEAISLDKKGNPTVLARYTDDGYTGSRENLKKTLEYVVENIANKSAKELAHVTYQKWMASKR